MTVEELAMIAASDHDCPGIHEPAPLTSPVASHQTIVLEHTTDEPEIRSLYSEVYGVRAVDIDPACIRNTMKLLREYERRKDVNQRHVKIMREGVQMVRFEIEGYPAFRIASDKILTAMMGAEHKIYAVMEEAGNAAGTDDGKTVLML